MKTSSKTEKAKEYLQNFKNKNWKFNKNNQNFILKFILYDKIFPKEYFEIFKEYLVNMHKETKAKFIKSCEDFVQKYKEDIDNAEKLNTMINGHDLKFSDVEKKKEFLNAVHNRFGDFFYAVSHDLWCDNYIIGTLRQRQRVPLRVYFVASFSFAAFRPGAEILTTTGDEATPERSIARQEPLNSD